MASKKKSYRVWHERKGYIQVFAKNEKDAEEEYYHALEGILGHQLGLCLCFNEKRKPIDRSKVLRIVRVELVKNNP